MSKLRFTYTGLNGLSRIRMLENMLPENPLLAILRDHVFEELEFDEKYSENMHRYFCYIAAPTLTFIAWEFWRDAHRITVKKITGLNSLYRGETRKCGVNLVG